MVQLISVYPPRACDTNASSDSERYSFTCQPVNHSTSARYLQESADPLGDGHPPQPLAGGAEGPGGRRRAGGAAQIPRPLHLLAARRPGR